MELALAYSKFVMFSVLGAIVVKTLSHKGRFVFAIQLYNKLESPRAHEKKGKTRKTQRGPYRARQI